ncbi:MAG: ABC transporter permease [Bacteriovoracaceae bacterium]
MVKFFAKKILAFIPTFFLITLVSFALIRLVPGDPVMLLLGERGANPATYLELKTNLGLDKPLPIQYLNFMKNFFQGDFGTSIVSHISVWEEFKIHFPATVELSIVALIWSTILGIGFGILAAYKKNSLFDVSLMSISLAGYSLPIFWWGLMLIMFFSLKLNLMPISGRINILYEIPEITGFMLIDSLKSEYGWTGFWDALHHLILPSVVLGTIPFAILARITRTTILEVINEDYIKAAKARGIPMKKIVIHYSLKNALIPIITMMGILLGSLLTGAILTETIFSIPGMGKWLLGAVEARDYPVIQSSLILITLIIMFINILVDLIYALINPKVRR